MAPAATTDPGGWNTAALDLSRPSAARMYDYYLGGGHNFSVDRAAANQVIAAAPGVLAAARANRAFLRRAVSYALDHDVRQFLDLGCGIPTAGTVHELVHAVDATARVVYVDVDPVAAMFAEQLLDATPTAGVIEADLRNAEAILDHPVTQRLLDFSQPICVLLVCVLHFVDGDIETPIAVLRERMGPGSLLVISHATNPGVEHTEPAAAVKAVYARTTTPICFRGPDDIAALFTGFDLVPPNPDSGNRPAGLVPVDQWRPEPPEEGHVTAIDEAHPCPVLLAGVGHKPRPPVDDPATTRRVKARNAPKDRSHNATRTPTTRTSAAAHSLASARPRATTAPDTCRPAVAARAHHSRTSSLEQPWNRKATFVDH